MKYLVTGLMVSALALSAGVANAEPTEILPQNSADASAMVQPLRGKDAYRAIFAALRASNWAEAKTRTLALDADDPVRPVALAKLYTAKASPRVELFDLLDLLNKASWLPESDQLGRMAKSRGAELVPNGPQIQKLVWLGTAPKRRYVATVKEDLAAQALVSQIIPFIKNDDPAGAEALINAAEAGRLSPAAPMTYAATAASPTSGTLGDPLGLNLTGATAQQQPAMVQPLPAPTPARLSPDGLAEVRQRVAWSYYIENDDANARRLAKRALDSGSSCDWAVQAHWTIGLSAWRQNDSKTAAASFAEVARRSTSEDMRAAGAYWAARAWMNAGKPELVEGLLRQAAGSRDSFYGMLARETLGIPAPTAQTMVGTRDLDKLGQRPAVKAALAMRDIGEDTLADALLRRQAELGGGKDFDALLALTDTLDMPETQLWLAHHGPAGHEPDSFARFPAPHWRPDGGWRVDPGLVYAHALQESNFRSKVVSPAGARGLMQVMPGTARLVGGTADQLFAPSTNIEYGQRYLEQLRDSPATGGLLPKVMAAYNAGPAPVLRWNSEVRDGGDPLLFMESLPYYETRAYVNIVMRNYWMYQLRGNGKAQAMTAMAEGKWPVFPTMRGGKVAFASIRKTR